MRYLTPTRTVAVAVAAALLAACGDTTITINEKEPVVIERPAHDHDHDHEQINFAGRLVVSAIDNPFVQVLELPAKTELNTFMVSAAPAALYSSGDFRYAAVVQRNQDLVNFIDGGLWQEDHVDHLHDYQEAPRLMPFQLMGVRPTHFQQAPGQLAVFFDGNAATGASAGVAVLTDADIGEDRSDFPTLTLTTHQHGAAQARGEFLLSTLRDENSSTTLPSQVALYKQHGDHFHQEQVFSENCPNLHGSAQNQDFVVFGCSDGVLVIEQQGNTFSATKLANSSDITGTQRIGTLAGETEAKHFVGIAGASVFAIDTKGANMTQLDWQPGSATAVWGMGFADSNKRFVLLDNTGHLTIFRYNPEPAAGQSAFTFRSKVKVTEADLAELPAGSRFQLAISAADDKVYITDPIAKQLITIDAHDAEIKSRKQLNFTPHRITWLGIADPSDDHHHH